MKIIFKNKRVTEALKTILIFILILNGIFLAAKTRLFDDFFESGSGRYSDKTQNTDSDSTTYQQAAVPFAAAVKGSSGIRYGVKYDSVKTEEVYEKFRTELGEALGSASLPAAVDYNEWRTALTDQGVYFDYGTDIPLDMLARWLGTELINKNNGSARRIILTDDNNEGVLLYYMDMEGKAWKCETKADWPGISSELEAFLPNGAKFAFQKTALQDTEPYELILTDLPVLYKVTANGSAFDDMAAERFAGVLGVGMYSDSSYTEPDGTRVYINDSGTIRLGADGYISYNVSEGDKIVYAMSSADMVEASRSIFQKMREVFAGNEMLYFTGMQIENDICIISFNYFVQGAEVRYDTGDAATAVFTNGNLTQLKLKIRSYKLTGEKVDLLPEYQAAAAAGILIKGSEAKLVLADGGGDAIVISPKWVA